MMEQQYSEKDQVDKEACEATYIIIHSISTQYVHSDDKQCKSHDSSKPNDNVTVALNNMDIMESSNKKKDIKNIKEKSHITNQINNVKQVKIVPTLSRWQKTFNIAQEILMPGSTDRPTHTNTALQYRETYTNVTYVELLYKIAECNVSHIDTQLKEINGAIHVKTRNGILLVPIDNFHSYLHQENDIHCIVCHMKFSKTEADIHKYEVRHMIYIVKIIDQHGFRKVNYSYSHCVICNLRVNKKEATAHVKKSHHNTTRKLLAKK